MLPVFVDTHQQGKFVQVEVCENHLHTEHFKMLIKMQFYVDTVILKERKTWA